MTLPLFVQKPRFAYVDEFVWTVDIERDDLFKLVWSPLEVYLLRHRKEAGDARHGALLVINDHVVCSCGHGQQLVEIGELITLAWKHKRVDAVLEAFHPMYGHGKWTLITLSLIAPMLPPCVVDELVSRDWLYASNQLLVDLTETMRRRQAVRDKEYAAWAPSRSADNRNTDDDDDDDTTKLEARYGIDCYAEGTVLSLLEGFGFVEHGISIGQCRLKAPFDTEAPYFTPLSDDDRVDSLLS